MRFIVEGPDGVGKTTVVNWLADRYGCDVIHMTEKGSKHYSDYLDKCLLCNMVSDRSFLSEVVYSIVFDRRCNLPSKDIGALMKAYRNNGWHFIILDADTEVIKNRLGIRGDEDQCKIDNIERLRTAYRTVALLFDIEIINAENLEKETLFDILEGTE